MGELSRGTHQEDDGERMRGLTVMRRRIRPVVIQAARSLVLACMVIHAGACGRPVPESPGTETASTPDSLPRGLLVALSQFEVTPEGRVLPKPKAALLEILVRRNGAWDVIAVEDPDSNVFHKAMVYDDGTGPKGILTFGGTAAAVKLWRKGASGLVAETLWRQDFGGKFSRMREAELADLDGDGRISIIVATHDQGVVAVLSPGASGVWEVSELDRQENTFVHEIEVGDLDGDGRPEIYATPSAPNLLDGTPQPGQVVRYVPALGEGRTVVADLGSRHAKEILVRDMDGDGRDELYVSVEAVEGGELEIRRYVESPDGASSTVIARLPDPMCRFLTAGDLDGDGRPEIVAAALRSGLWLLRPTEEDPGAPWQVTSIDHDSSGFEHAALAADLDDDGVDELYAASDDQGEIRRYVWRGDGFSKEVIRRRAVPGSVFTWNLEPVPVGLVE